MKSFLQSLFIFFLVGGLLGMPSAYSESEDIELTLSSLTNIRGNGAMEVCGTAIHQNGEHPLLVTVKHDISFYTTLTAGNDEWCVLVKRWTYDGYIEISATTLDDSTSTNYQKIDVPKINE